MTKQRYIDVIDVHGQEIISWILTYLKSQLLVVRILVCIVEVSEMERELSDDLAAWGKPRVTRSLVLRDYMQL